MSRIYVITMLLLLTSIGFSAPGFAASSDFDIQLAHNSASENAAKAQLVRLLDTYDVRPFTFTYSIIIDETAGPHSHPVLTLNDYFLKDDASALSTFIHEQMHWFQLMFANQIDAAIEDLKIMYPDMPRRGRGGGRNARETFIHLIVGMQELQATASLLGKREARRVIADKTWYRWIYSQILEREPEITTLLQKHNLFLVPLNSAE